MRVLNEGILIQEIFDRDINRVLTNILQVLIEFLLGNEIVFSGDLDHLESLSSV